MPRYQISEGVHRCVAAREAGLFEIRAVVDTDGRLGPVESVALAELYSRKPQIGRWDRGRDFLGLVQVMADAVRRDSLDPVILTVVPDRVAKYLTPLPDVIVNPV